MALFGGGKPDHPMADIKQARALIAELPANNAQKALEEVTFWLDSIIRTEGFTLDQRYQLFDLLDQAAKNHQRKLSQEYLATNRQDRFRENKLWTANFEFWKMLGAAYDQCIDQFRSGAGNASAVRKNIPTIIARVMRVLTLQLKWILLRYGLVDDRAWGDLGRLYMFAEDSGMVASPVEIYPGQHGQGTIRQEFLKALMLSISSTDGLTPLKQEIAERAVAHFGSLYMLQPEPAPGYNYFFDVSARKPPARVIKGAEPGKTMRYFGAGPALPALEQLMRDITANRIVPPSVNLGGTYELDVVTSVLQHLALYWSDTPPARNSERRKIATQMTVVNGFQQIVASVAPAAEDDSLDFQETSRGESWIVENVSDGGFGAIIPQGKVDWLKVGALLGVQTETAQFWGAGMVRRLTRDEFQQRRAGIQLLSMAVIPAMLTPAADSSSFSANSDGSPALLLSSAPDKNGEIVLLLREGSFSPRQAFNMEVRGKQYYLMPGRLVEGGEDFDLASFKVMKRE